MTIVQESATDPSGISDEPSDDVDDGVVGGSCLAEKLASGGKMPPVDAVINATELETLATL